MSSSRLGSRARPDAQLLRWPDEDEPDEGAPDEGAPDEVPDAVGGGGAAALPDQGVDLPSLTGMRWGAAFAVFCFHVAVFGYASGTAGRLAAWAFGAGMAGVSFFFVLSGFVLAWSARPDQGAIAFWRRRIARIYPLHLVTAVAALVLGATLVPGLRPRSVAEMAANLALVSGWTLRWWQSLDPPSWSLTCEAFFYLLFPLLWAVVRRLAPSALYLLAVASAATVVVLPYAYRHHMLDWYTAANPLARLPEFVLGMALATLVRRGSWRGPGLGTAGLVTAVGYFAAGQLPIEYGYAACTVAGIALLLPAAATADLTGGPSGWRRPGVVRLGEWSFAFYLVHVLVMRVVGALGIVDPGRPPLVAFVGALGVLLVSLELAWLLHVVVERPARSALLRPGSVARGWPRATAATLAPALAGGAVLLAARGSVAPPGPVVVLGASVANGYGASRGAAWPQLLAGRPAGTGTPLRVVNLSADAGRLLRGKPKLRSTIARETAALAVPDVATIVLTDLVNDLQQEPHEHDPRRIEAGVRYVATQAHLRGVRVVVTTIPPYRGFFRYEPEGERCRQAVNAWLRSTGTIDGVVDADALLADPRDPSRLAPRYDAGDHLHLNDAGHRALAASVSP